MIEVRVIRILDNRITYQAQFESQELAQSWIESQLNESSKPFGKPERWVLEDEEDISSAIASREREILSASENIDEDGVITTIPAQIVIEYKLPCTYIIQIEDVTSQVEQKYINMEAEKYLRSTDWYIIREIDGGVPCPPDIKIARADARVRIVR